MGRFDSIHYGQLPNQRELIFYRKYYGWASQFKKGGKALLSMYARDIFQFARTLLVVEVNHLSTQSTLRKAVTMAYEINGTISVAREPYESSTSRSVSVTVDSSSPETSIDAIPRH